MRLVDDNVLPTELFERRFFADAEFVGRDENIKLLGEDDVVDLLRLETSAPPTRQRGRWTYPFLLRSGQDGGSESRDPFVDFPVPVVQCGFRHNDEVRSRDPLVKFEVSQERDRL
jgi:hypothetical protein